MWRLSFALWFTLLLTSLGSAVAAGAGAVRAQPTPEPPLWEQWFAALNGGDVDAVLALMHRAGDEAGSGEPRCAGGCLGMDVIEASLRAMVADGYQGIIIPATVQMDGPLVSFDVVETAATVPAPTVRAWRMELDGDLIAPACEQVCLRSPAARTIPAAPVTPATPATVATPLPPVASAVLPASALAPAQEHPAQAELAASEALGPTPAGWVVAGLVVVLLILAVSAACDFWQSRRRTPPVS